MDRMRIAGKQPMEAITGGLPARGSGTAAAHRLTVATVGTAARPGASNADAERHRHVPFPAGSTIAGTVMAIPRSKAVIGTRPASSSSAKKPYLASISDPVLSRTSFNTASNSRISLM